MYKYKLKDPHKPYYSFYAGESFYDEEECFETATCEMTPEEKLEARRLYHELDLEDFSVKMARKEAEDNGVDFDESDYRDKNTFCVWTKEEVLIEAEKNDQFVDDLGYVELNPEYVPEEEEDE